MAKGDKNFQPTQTGTPEWQNASAMYNRGPLMSNLQNQILLRPMMPQMKGGGMGMQSPPINPMMGGSPYMLSSMMPQPMFSGLNRSNPGMPMQPGIMNTNMSLPSLWPSILQNGSSWNPGQPYLPPNPLQDKVLGGKFEDPGTPMQPLIESFRNLAQNPQSGPSMAMNSMRPSWFQ